MTPIPHYYLYDVNGNVGQLVNAPDGAISAHYEYDPFGNNIVANGPEAESNPYRFSTKYFDSETELYYYGYRYYSSQLGRWLNRDPLEEKGGINLYAFIQNSSVNLVDTNGLYAYGYPTSFEEAITLFGSHLEKLYEDAENKLSSIFNDVIDSVKDIFRQFNERAKSKVKFSYDIRKPGINLGIFKTKYGGVLVVESDGCYVKVSGGPTISAVASGKSLITLAGGVTVTGKVKYKYSVYTKKEEWGGSIGGTGFVGLRIGLSALVIDAYVEGGIYVSYVYDFSKDEDEGDLGVGLYARAVFEADLFGAWKKRRQYKYTYGDPDAFF